MMRLDLVFPRLPPAHDAIGEHTALLASALAGKADVRILAAVGSRAEVPGVTVREAYDVETPEGVQGLLDLEDLPDWLVVQYNPFSWGRWGFNPHLVRVLRALKRRRPALRLALIVHETAPPPIRWQLALMNVWQRPQLWRLGRLADLVFFTIEPWMGVYGRYFRGTPVAHLPVGSNIPDAVVGRRIARARLGLEEAFVVGLFGTAHHSRLLSHVRAAVAAIHARRPGTRVVYIGPDGVAVRERLAGLPVHDAGRLPGEDVALHFAAMDLYLAPFRYGVSTRRGSFMVALQHGIPSVSTMGWHTGPLLRQHDGHAFLLAQEQDEAAFVGRALSLVDDEGQRARLGKAARDLYTTHFDWPALARQMLDTLHDHASRQRVPTAAPEVR